jgi:hypothetical protein
MLNDRILNKETGYIFYGLTPPKRKTEEARFKIIADKQVARLKNLNLDGLILYDIQDESSRTNEPRPFPFMETLAPDFYSNKYLSELNTPKIIYNSVGKYNRQSFKDWTLNPAYKVDYSVFVGSPSQKQQTSLSLSDAYKIKKELKSDILLGGVTIPERHFVKGDEHIRVFNKMDQGCSFFISQCVYKIENSKNFLSDYYYGSLEQNRALAPIIFTLTPCGSLKTLEFMNWLGIDIPVWLKNDLKHSKNILAKSVEFCELIAAELIDFCSGKNIPIGFNIESVAIRKEEIDASIELLKSVKKLMFP